MYVFLTFSNCLQMRNAIQAEDLMNVMNNTPSIRNFYKSKMIQCTGLQFVCVFVCVCVCVRACVPLRACMHM